MCLKSNQFNCLQYQYGWPCWRQLHEVKQELQCTHGPKKSNSIIVLKFWFSLLELSRTRVEVHFIRYEPSSRVCLGCHSAVSELLLYSHEATY